MEVRPGANPADVKNYDTDRLRHDFLIQDLFAVQKKFHLQVMMLQILQSSISTVHRHTRLIRQYLSTLQRTFFLKIRRNLDVLKVQITEQSTSTFFLDRLKAVSLKWV